MLVAYASHLLSVATLVARLEGHLRGGLSSENRELVQGTADDILQMMELVSRQLPLPSSLAQARRIALSIRNQSRDVPPSVGQPAGLQPLIAGHSFAALLRDLNSRLMDEVGSQKFLYVPPNFAPFYEQPMLFGDAVHNAFPSAIDDIAEAGKCLALKQGTATVFHLMRVMEVGLKALSQGLGIPYAPSWESHLKQINDRISTKHKRKGIKWKRDEPFFRDVAGDLQLVKLAWRNPTMHIVKKYTPEEADNIFRAVCSFMQRIAERLKEAN